MAEMNLGVFDGLRGHDSEQLRQVSEADFESRCVRSILKLIRVSPAAAGLPAVGLTLAQFFEVCPGFPLDMVTARVRYQDGSRIAWTDLFGSAFLKLPCCTEFAKHDDGEPRALLFPVVGASLATIMVLHNAGSDAMPAGDNTRIVRKVRDTVFVIESLADFLAKCGTWDTWQCQ